MPDITNGVTNPTVDGWNYFSGVTFGICQTKLIPSKVTFDGQQTEMILNDMTLTLARQKRFPVMWHLSCGEQNGPRFVGGGIINYKDADTCSNYSPKKESKIFKNGKIAN